MHISCVEVLGPKMFVQSLRSVRLDTLQPERDPRTAITGSQ